MSGTLKERLLEKVVDGVGGCFMGFTGCTMVVVVGLSIFINVITFLASAIAHLISLFHNDKGDCEQVLQPPIFWLALTIAVITIIVNLCIKAGGQAGAVPFATCASLIFAILIVSLFAWAFSITSPGGGEVLPGKAYKEYRLTAYSEWLQKRANDTKRWSKITNCLRVNHVCGQMSTGKWANTTLEQFYTKRLSSTESGCCKPSNDCNFSYISPTNWTETTNSTYTNPDCHAWDNDPKIMCFNCQSCKAGMVDKFKHNWFQGVLAGLTLG